MGIGLPRLRRHGGAPDRPRCLRGRDRTRRAPARRSGAGSAHAAVTTISAELSEFAIEGQFTVPAGQVVIDVTNAGTMEHNLALADPAVQGSNLAAGESEQLDLGTLAPGTYQLLCTIPGHEASGMTTDLVVSPAGGATDDSATAGRRRGDEPHRGRTRGDDRRRDGSGHDGVDARLPGRDRGRRQPAARVRGAGRRHQAVRTDRRGHPVGGVARQDRRCLDVQRHGARADDQGRRRRQGAGHPAQRDPDGHRHPLARYRHAERPGRRVAVHAGTGAVGRVVHLRVRAPRTRRSACTTPTCTARRRSSTGCSPASSSARTRSHAVARSAG